MMAKIDGVVLVNGAYRHGRREAELSVTQRTRDMLLDPAALRALTAAGRQGAFLSSMDYLEVTEFVAPPVQLGFAGNTKLTWTSASSYPAGRHVLEPHAIQLAETDAALLGDGGNGYALGQPVLGEFLREYLQIPAEAFTPRPDARDPVAVWTLTRKQDFVFYAVNRERFPATVDLELRGVTALTRVSNDEPVTVNNGVLRLALAPYELRAFRAAPNASLGRITMTIPPPDLERVRAQVRWLQELESSVVTLALLNEGQRATLRKASAEATTALAEGRLWRARTLLEHHSLQEIYSRVKRAPPKLREPEGS
jgi:hypothetical protein